MADHPDETWARIALTEWVALDAVIAHASFAAAARRLKLDAATLRARVARLEEQVGARLVEPGADAAAVVPTAAGRLVAAHARQIVMELRAADRALGDAGG